MFHGARSRGCHVDAPRRGARMRFATASLRLPALLLAGKNLPRRVLRDVLATK